jgi:hypothetical protein
MGWIELADVDREKYGTPERIPLEYGRWGLKSIDALETEVGWTVEDLTNALQRRKRDADGNVVTRDELDDDGNPVLDENDKPKQIEVSAQSPRATLALVWLCLRSIGIRIPWDEFDIHGFGLRISYGDDDEGKAEESAEEPPA